MQSETLKRLEMLNQLSLSEKEEKEALAFFADREDDMAEINKIDTENTERMVHVIPVYTVVREDVVSQPFTREELQSQAPETDEGYWCVPKVME